MDLYPMLRAYDSAKEAEHALSALDNLLSSAGDSEIEQIAYLTHPILNKLREATAALEVLLPKPACTAITSKEK